MEKNQVNINLSTDIKTENIVPLDITLMSRDINNNSFLLKFKSDGADVQLNNSFTVEILSVFPNSKIEILTQAIVYGNTAMWEFDTKYITRNEIVSNYVYVKKDGVPIISADANAFTFNVGLSKIDGNAGKTAESYDRNYEKVLHEFEVAINLTKDELAQMADEARTFIGETRDFADEIKGVTVDEFVELKMGEELANLEVNYATRLVDLETNNASLITQLAQKANQIGIDVTNPPNGLTPAKADGVTDNTLAINNILTYAESQGIQNVIIPEGNYVITDTINLFYEMQLTLSHNAVIMFNSLTNNIFKMASRSVLKGGKVITKIDFVGSIFYYEDVVHGSTVDDIKCYGTRGMDYREINTGVVVRYAGYYPTDATTVGYCQANTVKNVYAEWYGLFLKTEANWDRTLEDQVWFTENGFYNIELERVNQIVHMEIGGGCFFDHMRTQCGPDDVLLYYLGGNAVSNRFTNLIYYDIVGDTQILEMDTHTVHNYFELWYDEGNYRDLTIDRGYRNRIESPGAMLEVPKLIPLTAEWGKTTGVYTEPSYFKTKEGIVHLEGALTNLTKTTGQAFNALIGTLPEGYRPTGTTMFSVASGPESQANIVINPWTGEIRAYSNVEVMYLDNVSFRTIE